MNHEQNHKPGPKGLVLEPHAESILSMYRAGSSMRAITEWLAQPPRSVSISRQSVHSWIGRRLSKLQERSQALGAAINLLDSAARPAAGRSQSQPARTAAPPAPSVPANPYAPASRANRGLLLTPEQIAARKQQMPETALDRLIAGDPTKLPGFTGAGKLLK